MEKENEKEFSEITIHAHDEEEAHRLVSAVFQGDREQSQSQGQSPKSKNPNWTVKGIFSNIGAFLYFAGLWICRIVLFIMMTPFYLLAFIRNLIGSAVIIVGGYWFIFYGYYTFSGQYDLIRDVDTANATLFTDTRCTILAVLVVGFAALATFEEIRDGF